MRNLCSTYSNKQINLACFYVLSNLHIRGLRTGNFDKYKYMYEPLKCHIKQLVIGYCIRGFLTSLVIVL